MFQQFFKKIPIPSIYFLLTSAVIFAAILLFKVLYKFKKYNLDLVEIIDLDYKIISNVVGLDFLNQPSFWIAPPFTAFLAMFLSSFTFNFFVLISRTFISNKFSLLSQTEYSQHVEKNINSKRFCLNHAIHKIKFRVTLASVILGVMIVSWQDISASAVIGHLVPQTILSLCVVAIYASLFIYVTSDFFVVIFRENNTEKKLDCYRVLQDIFRENYFFHFKTS